MATHKHHKRLTHLNHTHRHLSRVDFWPLFSLSIYRFEYRSFCTAVSQWLDKSWTIVSREKVAFGCFGVLGWVDLNKQKFNTPLPCSFCSSIVFKALLCNLVILCLWICIWRSPEGTIFGSQICNRINRKYNKRLYPIDGLLGG